MKEFIEIVNKTIKSLREICENLTRWENQNVFKNMESIVGQINQVFTIILSNKELLETYGLTINENEIIKMLGNMLTSMENKDTVLLLDTMNNEIVPLLVEIENKTKM